MRVYVAASSAEIDRADRVIAQLRAMGVTVTSTWPAVVRANGDPNPRYATLTERRRFASVDLHEVREADVLLLLVPMEAAARGAYYEAGYADALGKVVICAGDTLQSVFTARGLEFATDTEAVTRISEIGEARPIDLTLKAELVG